MKYYQLIYLILISFLTNNLYATAEEDSQANIQATAKKAPIEQKATKKRNLEPFKNINVSGIGNLYINQSNEEGFTVEADLKILPLVLVEVKDDTLFLGVQQASEHADAKINYYLNVKDLKTINFHSASSMLYIQGFKTEELAIALLGDFSGANIKIEVDKLTTKIEGTAKVTATGTVNEQEITINGVGEYHAAKLSSKNANVNISGSGGADINAKENLNINISGNGLVKYCGKPVIKKNISGNAAISTLEENQCQ